MVRMVLIVLVSDKNDLIKVSEFGIDIKKDEKVQTVEFADIKDVQIADGNILEIKTEAVTLKYQLVGTENNQNFMNTFGINKLKANKAKRKSEQNNANNTGNINQITVNVPSHGEEELGRFAVMAGKKPISKVTYCVLAILLGGIGVHKFYAGKIGMGIVYLIFCWTFIPGVIGLIEGLIAIGRKTDAQGMIYI